MRRGFKKRHRFTDHSKIPPTEIDTWVQISSCLWKPEISHNCYSSSPRQQNKSTLPVDWLIAYFKTVYASLPLDHSSSDRFQFAFIPTKMWYLEANVVFYELIIISINIYWALARHALGTRDSEQKGGKIPVFIHLHTIEYIFFNFNLGKDLTIFSSLLIIFQRSS